MPINASAQLQATGMQQFGARLSNKVYYPGFQYIEQDAHYEQEVISARQGAGVDNCPAALGHVIFPLLGTNPLLLAPLSLWLAELM